MLWQSPKKVNCFSRHGFGPGSDIQLSNGAESFPIPPVGKKFTFLTVPAHLRLIELCVIS